jgi:hypothetical protein
MFVHGQLLRSQMLDHLISGLENLLDETPVACHFGLCCVSCLFISDKRAFNPSKPFDLKDVSGF